VDSTFFSGAQTPISRRRARDGKERGGEIKRKGRERERRGGKQQGERRQGY
jgi:hypothetical protein